MPVTKARRHQPASLGRDVGVDHHRHELLEADLGLPSEDPPGLRGVADQLVDLGRAHEPLVLLDVRLPVVDADVAERGGEVVADRVCLAGRDDVVVGLLLLEHQPHRLDVVAGEAPVTLGVEVAEHDVLLRPEVDPRHCLADLPGHELRPTARRLVVEEDPRGGVHAVGLAVVDGHVVAEDLGDAVGRARPQQGRLALRHLLHLPEHLRARGLVEAHRRRVVARVQAHGLEHRQHALAGHVGRQRGVLPRERHEADGAEVVDLVGPGVPQRADQAGHVGQVAVVQPHVGEQPLDQAATRVVLTPDEPVHVVALGEQQLGQVQTVLSGDAGDQRRGHAGHCASGCAVGSVGVTTPRRSRSTGLTALLNQRCSVTEYPGRHEGSRDRRRRLHRLDDGQGSGGGGPHARRARLAADGPAGLRRRPDLLRGRHRRPRAAGPDRRGAPRPRRHHPHGGAHHRARVGRAAL